MTSDEAHYSIAKGANFLGFGSDSVVKVKTDERGIVIPQDLENKIQQCKQNVSINLLMLTRESLHLLL
jgi:glutamate/tyrosine decarboxylase-like PLP-dependent enzyme